MRVNLKNIKTYLPGLPIEEVEREYGISGVDKLASNENPLGTSPRALEAINRELLKINQYPEGSAPVLIKALSQKYGMPKEYFAAGNGSDEVMQLIAAAFISPGDEVIISRNTFSIYELVTRVFSGTPVFVRLKNFTYDLDGMLKAITPRTKIIFISNPNNPTGTIVRNKELAYFLTKVPARVLVVLDEAYAEYVEDKNYPQSMKHVRDKPNVIVLRSFSKIYGLGGIRLGYGIARPAIIRALDKVRLPFNVNRLAQAAGAAALSDRAFLQRSFNNNQAGKKFLYAELDKMGLDYVPTEANFICINLNTSAERVGQQLVKQGVIVRPLGSFGLPRSIRVTIGIPRQNRKFIRALKTVIR